MDFRFITALVAFAGLFGLAFVILGVLQRSSNQRSRQEVHGLKIKVLYHTKLGV